ncbi:hypothetical protein AB0D32_03510 [Micromonospora sp. NPDC048170]|uniref:hypothetical protein n=1 Tax=Micromonospora sp. NPDC048170 TaxID=3154819 RepID=UPI00340B29D6
MSRARTRSLPRPACRPEGDLTAWREQRYACRCGEELRKVRMGLALNDWAHETLSGQRYRDDRPPLLRDDPARWWDELRRRMAGGDMRGPDLQQRDRRGEPRFQPLAALPPPGDDAERHT